MRRLERLGKRWTSDDDARLELLRDSGWSYRQIADELGRTTSAITSRLWLLRRLAQEFHATAAD